jgi:hypothetical protein
VPDPLRDSISDRIQFFFRLVAQRAFPHRYASPSGCAEFLQSAPVIGTVALDFCRPELWSRFWHSEETAIVAMPEASAHKHDS